MIRGKACHFEDSDGKCWGTAPNGICGKPSRGAAALVQHADFKLLCRRHPPYGFRALCEGKSGPEELDMLRKLRDPARCWYPTCAVVGASGNLLGARLGQEIDAHSAVIRINLAPDATMASKMRSAPHRHLPTWLADVGARTTWRVLTMEGYGYLRHYPRFWLAPPQGHGTHANMSGIPQKPLLAVSCHQPGRTMGRCRADRLRQVFANDWSASYLISPQLLHQTAAAHFSKVANQRTLSTGMTAIAFAQSMCGKVHLYGFGNGSCGDACYHYYDCGPTGNAKASQSLFLNDPLASGGYHNFSAQANVLLDMVRDEELVAHWGTCERNLGGAPPGFESNVPLPRERRGGRAGRGRGRRGRGRERG